MRACFLVVEDERSVIDNWLLGTMRTEELNMRICWPGFASWGSPLDWCRATGREASATPLRSSVCGYCDRSRLSLQSVVSGTVVLEVSLDDTAKITDIRVVRGIASLTEPAERSVRQWTFQSAKLDGKPVSSKVVVAFSFVPPNVGPRV